LLEGAKDKPDTAALGDTNSNVIALYKEVEKADAEPTIAQEKAASTTRDELSKAFVVWQGLKSKDIPSLNGRLKSAGQSEIDVNRPPRQEEHGSNEE
jgi:hypothetical protein